MSSNEDFSMQKYLTLRAALPEFNTMLVEAFEQELTNNSLSFTSKLEVNTLIFKTPEITNRVGNYTAVLEGNQSTRYSTSLGTATLRGYRALDTYVDTLSKMVDLLPFQSSFYYNNYVPHFLKDLVDSYHDAMVFVTTNNVAVRENSVLNTDPSFSCLVDAVDSCDVFSYLSRHASPSSVPQYNMTVNRPTELFILDIDKNKLILPDSISQHFKTKKRNVRAACKRNGTVRWDSGLGCPAPDVRTLGSLYLDLIRQQYASLEDLS